MPLVIIQASQLSSDQKKRVGDRIMESFHREGVPASSVVVLFKPEDTDIYLDGGLLIEAQAPAVSSHVGSVPYRPVEPSISEDSDFISVVGDAKGKARPSKPELAQLKAQLIQLLQFQGALSSFQAQEELGLKDSDWAPATLRRFFSELEEEGAILKQGQKRGTRYVWKGITSQAPSSSLPKLVKKSEVSEDPEE